MGNLKVFRAVIGEDQADEARWEPVDDCEHIVSYGDHDFVKSPAKRDLHAYVDGFPVVGHQALTKHDLVRIVGPDTNEAFWYDGRRAVTTEPAIGQICAFTGVPITDGLAVRCQVCGRVVSQDVVAQVGQCPCGAHIGGENSDDPELPPEELL